MTNRVINFYAGPAGLPLPALERAKEELLDFAGSGMSVMEISHRAKEYDAVHEEALSLVRELMGLPANYKVLMLQGGAHLSFGMIPLNLLRGGRKADYILTGNWAEKAYKEAKLVGGDNVRVAASTKDEKFARLPKASELKIGRRQRLRALHLQQHGGRHAVEGLPEDRQALCLRHVLRHHVAPLRRQPVRPDLCRCPEEPRPLRRDPRHRPRGLPRDVRSPGPAQLPALQAPRREEQPLQHAAPASGSTSCATCWPTTSPSAA